MKWIPDLQPRFEADQRTWMEWLVRNFRKLSIWTDSLELGAELLVYGATITDDAGDGTVHGDLNATDFTGHPHADPDTPTALQIKTNAIVTFGHKVISYIWEGPNGVTVGVGGSYTAVSTDLVPLGTGDHAVLSNRDQPDQHPMSAITGLSADQQRQDSNLTAHTTRTDNPHQVNHSQLPDVGADPADPHVQYMREGLGGIYRDTPTTGFGDLTDTPQFIGGTAYTELLTNNPIGVTPDLTSGTLTLDETGIWQLSMGITGVIVQVTSNASNTIALAAYNLTDDVVSDQPAYFTVPRYGQSFSISASLPVNVDATALNKKWGLAIWTLEASPTITVTELTAVDLHMTRIARQ